MFIWLCNNKLLKLCATEGGFFKNNNFTETKYNIDELFPEKYLKTNIFNEFLVFFLSKQKKTILNTPQRHYKIILKIV